MTTLTDPERAMHAHMARMRKRLRRHRNANLMLAVALLASVAMNALGWWVMYAATP